MSESSKTLQEERTEHELAPFWSDDGKGLPTEPWGVVLKGTYFPKFTGLDAHVMLVGTDPVCHCTSYMRIRDTLSCLE